MTTPAAARRFFMVVAIVILAVALILVVFGLWLILSDIDAQTELTFLGQSVKSRSAGIIIVVLGAALTIPVFKPAINMLEHIAFSQAPDKVPSQTKTGQSMSETAEKALKARIVIEIPEKLEAENVNFGLLHVRDGKDEVPDRGNLLNEEIAFEPIDRTNKMEAVISYQKQLGFQYKCFVDYKNVDYETIKNILVEAGYENVSRGEGKSRRAWFLLPGTPTYQTVDGLINNYYYPS